MQKASILIVDDMPTNLRLLTQVLSDHGYQVRPLTSGARAIEAVQARLPDLILLDITMPEMDGYAVCKRLKADERTRDIPILFLSALNEVEDKVEAFAAGGEDYITKPFQVEEVLARVQTHLALRTLRESLKQQVAELDAFAHTVAHDLQNPIGVIVGYANVLGQDWSCMPAGEVDEALRTIARVGDKMNRIVEELLLLASTRQQEVALEPLDMGKIVNEARQRLAVLARERDAQIIQPPASAWPDALGYAPWVEEVWANYISNGIKYGGARGEPPRLELGFSISGPAASPLDAPGECAGRAAASQFEIQNPKSHIAFWVRDNGAGLSPEQQGKLFAPFERLGQTRVQGHGLGLSIVRRIVEKLGGEVGVESTLGQGSTFFFTLPAGQ